MVRRVHMRALLLAALILPVLLSGCHDFQDPPAPGPAKQPPAAPDTTKDVSDPIPIDNPLPEIRLTADGYGAEVALRIHIDGDPAAIAHHELRWGDGTGFDARPGAPATRYTHTYLPPTDWRAEPRTFTPKLTLYSSAGHSRSATTQFDVPPPPNTSPQTSLLVPTPPDAVPAHVTIETQSVDRDGAIQSWTFDPGDGTSILRDHGAPPKTFIHVYRQIGHHTATLTITDDAGATATAKTTIFAPPPKDQVVWSLSQANGTLYQHAPDGTIAASRTPFGLCHDFPCDKIIAAASQQNTLAALIDSTTESRAGIVDGMSGRIVDTIRLPPGPQDIYGDDEGRYWTTHRDGTITWFREGNDRPLGTVSLHAPGAETRLAFGPDGVAWALVSDTTTARLYRIDPIEGHASPMFLPIPAPAKQLALNHKHNVAVVLDEHARAWVTSANAWGPVLLRAAQLEGNDPKGVACPPAGDLCWAALAGPQPRLVPIDLRSQATTLTAAHGVALPGDGAPTAIAAHHDHLIIATGGSDPRMILADAENGTAVAQEQKDSAGRFRGHPTHPALVYHAHRDGRWGIFDIDAGREVHEALDAGGDMGPYLTKRPWQPGA